MAEEEEQIILLHLIMNLKTDSGRATFESALLCSTVVSLWFHLGLVHICRLSPFLGFLLNTSQLWWVFFKHQLVSF